MKQEQTNKAKTMTITLCELEHNNEKDIYIEATPLHLYPFFEHEYRSDHMYFDIFINGIKYSHGFFIEKINKNGEVICTSMYEQNQLRGAKYKFDIEKNDYISTKCVIKNPDHIKQNCRKCKFRHKCEIDRNVLKTETDSSAIMLQCYKYFGQLYWNGYQQTLKTFTSAKQKIFVSLYDQYWIDENDDVWECLGEKEQFPKWRQIEKNNYTLRKLCINGCPRTTYLIELKDKEKINLYKKAFYNPETGLEDPSNVWRLVKKLTETDYISRNCIAQKLDKVLCSSCEHREKCKKDYCIHEENTPINTCNFLPTMQGYLIPYETNLFYMYVPSVVSRTQNLMLA